MSEQENIHYLEPKKRKYIEVYLTSIFVVFIASGCILLIVFALYALTQGTSTQSQAQILNGQIELILLITFMECLLLIAMYIIISELRTYNEFKISDKYIYVPNIQKGYVNDNRIPIENIDRIFFVNDDPPNRDDFILITFKNYYSLSLTKAYGVGDIKEIASLLSRIRGIKIETIDKKAYSQIDCSPTINT